MSMHRTDALRVSTSSRGYATPDDFQKLFAREMMDMFRLAFLLTAEIEDAERSVILAIRECMSTSSVAKEWIVLWARRAVVRNAIRVVAAGLQSDENHSGEDQRPAGRVHGVQHADTEQLLSALGILALSDFHRMVYVICVLEGYAVHDCALLISRSQREVREAKASAVEQVIAFEQARRRTCQQSSLASSDFTRMDRTA